MSVTAVGMRRCRLVRALSPSWRYPELRCRSAASGAHPDVLWAPGASAVEEQTDKLAGKIGLNCRNHDAPCIVGARGEVATARAVRALAKASELGKSPVEFRVRWHKDADSDERALRFYAELRYTWADFKLRWQALRETPAGDSIRMLRVTQHTVVHQLATAMATELRLKGGVVLPLRHTNDTVMTIGAKALATLPHVAQNQAKAATWSCVLRWNLHDPDDKAGKFIYAHVFERQDDSGKV